MTEPTDDHYDTPLARRFRAAGIPVPPPLTGEERADLDRRIAEADAQPRVYGPKEASSDAPPPIDPEWLAGFVERARQQPDNPAASIPDDMDRLRAWVASLPDDGRRPPS